MKKRVIYSLLFGIPGFFISGVISFLAFGAAAGFLWIFVFGDNPWPSTIETAIPFFIAVVFFTIWIALIAVGFVIGKRLEQNPIMNKKHILIAVAVTILPVLFIVIQQWSVGNIGPKSDGQLCSDYCTRQGYSASSMPPRNSGEKTCSCLDQNGIEILKVPIKNIDLLK